MDNTIQSAGVAGLAEKFANKEISPVEAVETFLDQIDSHDKKINSMARVFSKDARAVAKEAEKRWFDGAPLSPLDGIPLTVKDSIDVQDFNSPFGAKGNEHSASAAGDAPLVSKLRDAGAIILGKTTMSDLGMLLTGQSSLHGTVRNPWDLATTPGGSSSGAAAGVAAGMASGSIGTDFAGSVRIPAAYCGLSSIKPTQGSIGHLPPSPVRSPGPLGKSLRDVSMVFSAIVGADVRDKFSYDMEKMSATRRNDSLAGLRVGVMRNVDSEYTLDEETEQAILAAERSLEKLGATLVPMEAPLQRSDFEALDRTLRVRSVSEIIGMGGQESNGVVLDHLYEWAKPAEYYLASQHYADSIRVEIAAGRLAAACSQFDMVLAPVLPHARHAAESYGVDPNSPLAHGRASGWVNQIGFPAVSLPTYIGDQLPVSVQLISQRFTDFELIDWSLELEQEIALDILWPQLGA